MSHAFGTCTQSHDEWSVEFGMFYEIHSLVSAAIVTTQATPAEKQTAYSQQFEEITSTFWAYVGHIFRTKHQGDYYRCERHVKHIALQI